MENVAQNGLACLFVVFDGCHVDICQTTEVILAELMMRNNTQLSCQFIGGKNTYMDINPSLQFLNRLRTYGAFKTYSKYTL